MAAGAHSPPRLQLEWRARLEPLSPCAALALGASASALLTRLLRASDDELARLTGVASARLVAVLGAEADLPWVDGIRYFGREALAPDLRLPTAHEATLPLPLLARAVARLGGGAHGPWLVCPEPELVVPLGGALSLERGRLEGLRRSLAGEGS